MSRLISSTFLCVFLSQLTSVHAQQEAVDWLQRMRSTERIERLTAAYDITALKPNRPTIDLLVDALSESDPLVVEYVVCALGELAAASDDPALKKRIASAVVPKLDSVFPRVRSHASVAAARCGEAAVPLLFDALIDMRWVRRRGHLGINFPRSPTKIDF